MYGVDQATRERAPFISNRDGPCRDPLASSPCLTSVMVLGAVAPWPALGAAGAGGPLGDPVPAGQRRSSKQVGETAMIALALIKADTPKTDPVAGLRACQDPRSGSPAAATPRSGRAGTTSTRRPWWRWCWRTWTARRSRRDQPAWSPAYLIGRQNANGSWDYTQPAARRHLDLAVRRCSGSGRPRTPASTSRPPVWDRAAGWFLSVQALAAGAGTTTATSRSIPTTSR